MRKKFLDTQPVTGISTRRLTNSDNLDNLSPLEPQIPRHRILLQDTRQLRLLQAVPLQQRSLLLPGEQHVPRHQLVVRNVDQQVVLEEALNLGQALDGSKRLAGGGRQRHGGHHDARLVVVGDCVLCKVADLRDAKLLVGQELDPDGAAVGHGVGVGGCDGRGVFAEHGVAWTGGELEFGAAVFGCMLAFAYVLYIYIYIYADTVEVCLTGRRGG